MGERVVTDLFLLPAVMAKSLLVVVRHENQNKNPTRWCIVRGWSAVFIVVEGVACD